jgi:NAD+ diphosphatase
MHFISSFTPSALPAETDLWFAFRGDNLLVENAMDGIKMLKAKDIAGLQMEITGSYYIGALDGTACYAVELDEKVGEPEGMFFSGLRPLFGIVDEDVAAVASRAFQVLYWERTHQFCGRCGGRTESKIDERAKGCEQCGQLIYPEISPAIIVAVTKVKEILLARGRKFPMPVYSVLAGFVEPGEAFEQAVKREIREEVGIAVKNIQYFGSQPWPFPNSIMVGFTAEHENGEIKIDESEIIEAGWYSADNLPALPRKGSISRKLIESFVERSGKGGKF